MKLCARVKYFQVLCHAVLAVFAASHGAWAYVMGADDRRPVTPGELALPEVAQTGIIEIGDGGYVTGILTGANCDVVISAGHAAYYWRDNLAQGRRRGGIRGDGKFRFRLPGRESEQDLLLVDSGFADPANLDNDADDWSIFKLARPALPACRSITYRANNSTCGGRMLMPAFHYDRRDTMLVDRTCAVKDILSGELLVHDCDTKDGSSGAPLYCVEPAGLKLMGVNISGMSWKELVDPGEYGKSSKAFDFKNHKNFAVALHGDFLRALEQELQASLQRKAAGP